jgi:serine protease Do
MQGEVVGLNSQIYSRTGGFMGLSFAIPIELAMHVAEQLRTDGRVTRGYLGVMIQDLDNELAVALGMTRPGGALVAEVLPDSPAARAGIRVGDVILAFGDHVLSSSSELPPLVGAEEVGTRVQLRVLHEGTPRSMEVTIAALPDHPGTIHATPEPVGAVVIERLGMSVMPLSTGERDQLGIGSEHGVLVADVAAGAAAAAGITPGEVILMLDGRSISSPQQLAEQVAELAPGRTVALLLQRDAGPMFVALRVPEG